MTITSITVSKIDSQESKLCGIANITFNNMFTIHDIKIIRTRTGWLLSMPHKENKSNKTLYKDIIHPINSLTRSAFNDLIIPAYQELEKSECSHMEFSLKEDAYHVDFQDLCFKHYETTNKNVNDISNSNIKNDIIISAITLKNKQPSLNRLQAIASITFDNRFVVHDIKILKDGDNLFIGMPSRRLESDSFKDIAHPINKDTRTVIERLLFEAYRELTRTGNCNLNWKIKEDVKNVDFLELCPEHFYSFDSEKNRSA